MFSANQKRRVPDPQPLPQHDSDHPAQLEQAAWQAFRHRVMVITSACIGLAVIGVLLYGPWLQIRDVQVTGTRLIQPQSVRAVAWYYLNHKSWGIWPRNTIVTFSSSAMGRHIQDKIHQRISVERVTAQRVGRTVTVNVSERTAVFLWDNSQSLSTIDRQGVIIDLQPAADLPLITIHDKTQKAVTVDTHAVDSEVIQTALSIVQQLKERQIDIMALSLPNITCPTQPIIETSNTNTEVPEEIPTNSASNSNTNTSINSNTPSLQPRLTPACDAAGLAYRNPEVHVQLKTGPVAYFDRHQNIVTAAAALQRVLQEPENRTATYIDLRFGNRVYIQ